MNDRYNKTSICSIVFLDIIEYSKKRDSEQIEVKNQFNALINDALKGMAENDRIILDTGDGAAIACQGSPEDVLFISLTIRDEILKSNSQGATPLYVRFGINLGPVRLVKDINNRPNIVGDGINVAQRIMSFAKPNQILVSRSYYEVTSRLTQETSQMFDYSGIKHDKHVREHEVYSVRPHKDAVIDGSQPIAAKDDRRLTHRLVTTKKVNLKYVALSLPAFMAAFVLLINASADTSAPAIILTQPPIANAPSVVNTAGVKSKDAGLLKNETNKNSLFKTANASEVDIDHHVTLKPEKNSGQENQSNAELAKTKLAKKEANKKVANKEVPSNKKTKQNEMDQMPPEFEQIQATNHSKPKVVSANSNTNVAKTAELTAEKEVTKKESGWSSFKENIKHGGENKCTQAQISMNQCS